MAEYNNFYDSQDDEETSTSSTYVDVPNIIIAGSSLTADTKYLIVARALIGGSSTTNKINFQVETPDDTDVEARSEVVVEINRTGADEKWSYMWVGSYKTSGTPTDVHLRFHTTSGATVRADQMSLELIELDQFGESGYWDGTVTDNDGAWTNDSNIADGTSASAFCSTTGSVTSNEIRIANNQHPTSGDVLEPVTVQFNGRSNAADGLMGCEVFDGGDSLMSGTFSWNSGLNDWTQPFHIPAPSGGWTATKMEGLEVVMWMVSGTDIRITKVDFRTGYVEHSPNNYVTMTATDIDDDGSTAEYHTTADTSLLAVLDGAALATDQYWILGSAQVEIGSTGRWFNHSIHTALDTSTSEVRALNQSEGEDTNEKRQSGFSLRHKASSGTPDVILYGQEEAANGNMVDLGAYLIALPTSRFADFEWEYDAGNIDAANETTIQTLPAASTYTPSVNGNHLIFGMANHTTSALGGLSNLWVDSTTTEIRTGDSTPSQTQRWDGSTEKETVRTFQRFSISGAVTLNLQGDRNRTPAVGFEHRWIVVVNLNPPSSGTVINAGLATETDTALGISFSFGLQPGLAVETDSALAVTVVKTYPVLLTTESDTALITSFLFAPQANLAVETDSALAITIAKVVTVGLATETDTALATAVHLDAGLLLHFASMIG